MVPLSSIASELDEGTFVLLRCTSGQKVDVLGFIMRRKGISLRDCLVYQTPEGTEFLWVGQVPTDQTFVEGVVRGSNSAIHVDAVRISAGKDYENAGFGARYGESAMPQMARHQTRDWVQDRIAKGEPVKVTKPHDGGRFPTNMILKHDHDCYVEGTEELPNWICGPDCPVRILNTQSGVLVSGTGAIKKHSSKDQRGNRGSAYGAESRAEGTEMISYGDEGGASRFFKQVQTEEELDSYLNQLIRGVQ